MIKLSELIDKEVQPGERVRMKNYLKGRPSRDQETIFQDDEPYRPENTHSSQRYNNGYPQAFEDPSGIFEDAEIERVQQSLIGREFQTLEDIRKMTSRLRQRGFDQNTIEQFIRPYLR